uniref:Uncharacterized protein n=1 Tax=Candidatus Kentrum sp. LPFa TaxID=2126335 RepID=A0A450W3F6_9GAMM|nr:MAG: hypothetical protein BECKLPF1236A_GA0070988_1005613 [Candidatus Kentron sp. LPFa]VFK27683.1 MAG: hypothetical protein BECKLPF1236C_GA0070990_1005013 [Candidatus Kentron sp. LPFa]
MAMNTPVTVFPTGPGKTEKTGKTDSAGFGVGNSGFLGTVFCNAENDTRPIVVSFAGDPTTVGKSAWFGHPWNADEAESPVSANNYFSLATFRPDEAGKYRRRKTQFAALHAVMLDDIGTKVPMERLTLPSGWLLETSPGNFQAGYLLREPLADGPLSDRLMNSIIAAGLCDPGASGPRTRLARLPVGVNGKHESPFPCRLTAWEPELRYSVDELVSGLQLEMARTTTRPKRSIARSAQPRPEEDDPIWLPRPKDNAVLLELRKRELYKTLIRGRKHDITCPWVEEHTGAVDSGTAYFEPDGNWPIGGFKCLHGHCAGRHIRDLLAFLNVEIDAARMKPTIRVIGGEIHRIVDAAERELGQAGKYYQRGSLIVTVATDPGTRDTRIQEISQQALVRELAGVATWERYDARAQSWVRIDPPARHASVLFDSVDYRHLSVLNGLARQPFLRPDGSLVTAPGYDAATGLFGVFDAKAFLIPETPSRIDAENALAVLRDLLAEFSFSGETDHAAALTAMLTASIRPSLPGAPMFHARAHMVSSGKSYLCELITAFATPRRGTPTTFPGDDEECRKFLLAELLRAPAVIEFDNLIGDLMPHKSLCTALTSEHTSGRILGVSKTATVSTRALFLSSGNNVGPVRDMTRRCITIHLSPQCEIPAMRTFKRPDLVREVLAERHRFVSAALTIIRAWIVAGRPKTECKALAGYGDWSDLCRQPLLWLGLADPTASVFEAMAEDPDREILARFLDAWFSVFEKTPAMVREAVDRALVFHGERGELREVLHDIAGERGEINRRKLGWWIRRHAGRIVDGRRILRANTGASASAERWRVEVVESVLSVFSVSSGPIGKTVTDTDSNAYARASRGN